MPDNDPSLASNNGFVSTPTKANTGSLSYEGGVASSTEDSSDRSEGSDQSATKDAVDHKADKEHYGYRAIERSDEFRYTFEIPGVFPKNKLGLPIAPVHTLNFAALVRSVGEIRDEYKDKVDASKEPVDLIKHACENFLGQYKTAKDLPLRHELVTVDTHYELRSISSDQVYYYHGKLFGDLFEIRYKSGSTISCPDRIQMTRDVYDKIYDRNNEPTFHASFCVSL
ncbi:hypothetical protein HD553DRAFT_362833 [Filobasidium floriforme]|uniref:uncharacterized protein n=1 Tax=Filobasidium floriforme TaxID=5210 RepID=UPI001E8DD531|nr:uncharacterized protein HD553DRAFT_362833 [Filobasidium floriforme]KAH8079639.1 hypothetical protein HD553DRAFT_362833 [Filobasidium floriforme]